MRRRLRPLLYLVIVVVWLVVMSLPVLAFLLATRGSVQIGGDARSNVRAFLVLEEDSQGVGIQWTRPHRDQPHCANTSLVYLLWEGEGENARYCQCFDPADQSVTADSC
ncbi:MAG: hypothetical protein AB1791_18940 [Chloroflexota bacterium]